MKKLLLIATVFSLSMISFAQSVGIGTSTPDPSAILALESNNKGFLLPGLSTTSRLAIPSPAFGLLVYDYNTKSIWMNGTSGWQEVNTDLTNVWLRNGADIYRSSGNVGIGTGLTTAGAKLQLNSRSSVNDPTLLITDSASSSGGWLKFRNISNTTGISLSEFSGSAYNNSQYLDVFSDSLNIATFRGNGSLGVRNLSPVYPLDITGDLNTTGALRLSGNAGTAGQVLTSNGNSAPSWQSAAYSNNIRFSFNTVFFGAITRQDDSLNFNYATPYYNLNPAMVAAVPGNSTRIQFNKSGLYHFEGTMYLETSSVVALNYQPLAIINFWINNQKFEVESSELINTSALPATQFSKHVKYQFEVYISAGQTLKLSSFFNGLSGSFFRLGNFRGHLISD